MTPQSPMFLGAAMGVSGPLQVEILRNGRSARLTHAYSVRTTWGMSIEVPAGFQTDFASVPRMFWRILPPWGPYSPAAVVHDYLYSTAMVTRAEADRIFLDLMSILGVPLVERKTIYWAVRAFGWRAWIDHRASEVAEDA